MPIYEYRCADCGHQLEAIQKVGDAALTDCPTCGKAGLKRLISAAGFQLKGSGWYATDFKNSGRAKEPKKGTEEKSSSDNESPGTEKKAHSCGSGACGCAG